MDLLNFEVKCPDCNLDLEVVGSEAYPASGLDVECVKCDWVGLHVDYDHKIEKGNSLKNALIVATNFLLKGDI